MTTSVPVQKMAQYSIIVNDKCFPTRKVNRTLVKIVTISQFCHKIIVTISNIYSTQTYMMSTDVGYSFQCMMDEVTRNRAVENPTNTTAIHNSLSNGDSAETQYWNP